MIVLMVIGFGLVMFGLGYLIGDEMGWDRCWKELTKNDKWRSE